MKERNDDKRIISETFRIGSMSDLVIIHVLVFLTLFVSIYMFLCCRIKIAVFEARCCPVRLSFYLPSLGFSTMVVRILRIEDN